MDIEGEEQEGGEFYREYLTGKDPTGMIAAYSGNKKRRRQMHIKPIPMDDNLAIEIEDIVTKLGKLSQVMDIFQWPVDKKEYPEYYQFVEKPVCLQDILDNLKGEGYQSLDEALIDLNLVWDNALAYNAEGSPFTSWQGRRR